jgi:hypothetical protein
MLFYFFIRPGGSLVSDPESSARGREDRPVKKYKNEINAAFIGCKYLIFYALKMTLEHSSNTFDG